MGTSLFDLTKGGLHALRNEPRLIGARRLREKGQNEQAISMLGDLLMSATDGTDGEQQMSLCLGPVYFEYGCALACAQRMMEDIPEEEEVDDEVPPAKRARLDGANNNSEEEGKDEEVEEEEDEEEEDDMKLAWKMLDQARCIYEKELEKSAKEEHREILSELARCSLALGDLNRDDEAWGDAVWEYSNCVEKYETRGGPYNEREEIRMISALAGAAGAYARHDTQTDLIAGADILIAKSADISKLANSFYQRARTRFEALLLRHKQMSTEIDSNTKTDIRSLAIELQDVCDRVLSIHSTQQVSSSSS
eukprot:CAMPEP_0197302818 /NCGR_PEP_ID=MMETSP0890-20130614/51288_1 /TAXON_ID=44058 ORGANISM="Aureoumbra lagunensis, Strain CCMP1510" /NCGR_SAMPLE_ID=MMETSP0890 /ASSEMBLY_ACC=CAM_ASM_000533 /LENGTH=307 /DNA_ID=CAMNT_0042782517 /DNA_START=6 /DNA_END=929 /DNA_ORIENTATION=-